MREDADRWTLVHEFMHHNFKTQANERGYDDDRTREARATLYAEIEAVRKDPRLKRDNRAYAEKLSRLFQRLIDVVDTFVVQYYFEEIAIEALLQEKYENVELRYVPNGSYLNASEYIALSKKKVVEMYQGLTSIYDELNRLTVTNGLLEDWRKLPRYMKMRDQRLAQLDKLIAKRKADTGGPAAAFGFLPSSDAILPCGHAWAVEADLSRISAFRLRR